MQGTEEEEWNRTDPEELFILSTVIGQGNYGRVYKAIKKDTGEVVAIKILPMDEDDLASLKKLELEIQVLRRCDHDCIVRYLGSYVKENDLWIVMEFCDGGSLATMMSKQGKPLSEDQISTVMAQMVRGLVYLHEQHMIHRDIKADNILLNSHGAAKLADLGVAAQLGGTMDQRRTATGTPYWMAPELVLEQEYGTKVDVWSLGITAIELADKKPPFFDMLPMRALFIIATSDKPPPTLTEPEKWSADFNDFIAKCLVKDPAGRATSEMLLEHPFIVNAPSTDSMIDYVREYIQEQEKRNAEKEERKRQARARREDQHRRLFETLQNFDTGNSSTTVEAVVHPFFPVCDECMDYVEDSPWDNPMISSGGQKQPLLANDERNDFIYVTELMKLFSDPVRGVKRNARKKMMRTHKDCFVGSEAVSWLQMRLSLDSREQAIAIGESLMHRGKIYHVMRSEPFLDSRSLYYRVNDKEDDDDLQNMGGKVTYLVEMMRWGIEIKDRKHRTRTYASCFVGSEAVDWIMNTLHMESREDAVDFAQMLVDRSVFHHVNFIETFVDRPMAFYRFFQDDKKYPAVSSKTRIMAFQRANEAIACYLHTQENLSGQ